MTVVPVADTATLREAFASFPSGIAAIAAMVDGAPTVLVASSFTVGVSLDPPLALFAVQHTSTTWPDLTAAPRLGVSLLGVGHAGVTRQLAGRDRARRLDGIGWRSGESGAVHLEGAPVWLECLVEAVHPAGDHDIVVLRVEGLHREPDYLPLVWHRSVVTRLAG